MSKFFVFKFLSRLKRIFKGFMHLIRIQFLLSFFLLRNTKIILFSPFLTDLRSYIKDVHFYYTIPKYLNSQSKRYFKKLANIYKQSNVSYQNGDWQATKVLLLDAEKLKQNYLADSGFNSKVRLIGPEITSSLGHMAISLSLRAQNNILFPEFSCDYVVLSGNSANDAYLNLWRKYFNFIETSKFESRIIGQSLWKISESPQTAPVGKTHLPLNDAFNALTDTWKRNHHPPLLDLNDEILSVGEEWSKKYGISGSDWFVTLHVRNSMQNRSGYGRNADIMTYLPAIKEVINFGGFVVVIGDNNQSKELPKINGLINYSCTNSKNAILDTYFLALNKFLIATTSGPLNVPITFGKPVLATNAPDLGKFVYYPGSLMIPKLVINKKGKVLSYNEMLSSKTGWTDSYINPDFSWRDNSPDEIKHAVREMLLFGDKYLQDRNTEVSLYKSILIDHSANPSTEISRYFLNKWKFLLQPVIFESS